MGSQVPTFRIRLPRLRGSWAQDRGVRWKDTFVGITLQTADQL